MSAFLSFQNKRWSLQSFSHREDIRWIEVPIMHQGLCPKDSEECPVLQGVGREGHLITSWPSWCQPNQNPTISKPSQFPKVCFHSQACILRDGGTDCSYTNRRTLWNFFFKSSQAFIKRMSLRISKYSEEMTLQAHPFLYLQPFLLVHPWNSV